MPGPSVTPVLIGRTREMETLERALGAAKGGVGRCVLIAGEAGIGKSRLIQELIGRAAPEGFSIVQGNCFEQSSSSPYAPWADALRAFLAQKSASETVELLGPLASEFVKLLPELSLLIPGLQPTPPLDPQAEKGRLFESIARLGASLSASHPMLVVLEDLHWSDQQSLELMRFFVRRVGTLPVLFLGTCRSEETTSQLSHHLAELSRNRLATEMQLQRLDRDQVEQLARVILKIPHPVEPGLLEDLERLAKGNPFLIEEVLKAVAASPGSQTPAIPRSAEDLTQREMEKLSGSARRILSLAAVIGDRFDFGLLQEIAVQDELSVLRNLKELIAARLVLEETADQYAFRHALVREAVYASLMLRERKALHQTIGETMERQAGAQVAVPAAPLAYHFYRAEDWPKAMEYSQRAGLQAQALYAPREALAQFSQAIDAARHLGLPVPGPSLRGRAQALEILGDFDQARGGYEAVLEMARREANRVDEWQALMDLGFLWQSRELNRAGEYFQSALELARILGEPSIVARTLNRVGNWHMNRGQAREALPCHRDALETFRHLHDQRGIAQTMDLLGIVSYQLGESIQGAAYLEQAVPILRDLNDRQGLVNVLTNLTLRARTETEVLGEIDYLQLTAPSDEAFQIAHGFNWYQGEALALIQGAISLQQAGRYGQALERVSRARHLVEESQNRFSLARMHLILGRIYVDLLALAEAQQHFGTGFTVAKELGSELLIQSATAHLAQAAVLQRDLERARALLTGMLKAGYPNGQELVPERACWAAWAELELADGRPGSALETIDRLLASAPNLAQYGPQAIPPLSRLRGQTLAALGRMAEAEAEFQGTLPVATRHGQRPILWRLHLDLGKLYGQMGRREDGEREFALARAMIEELGKDVPEGGLRQAFVEQAWAMVPPPRSLTQRQIAKRRFDGLTEREREIATLIARAKSNREIADELTISEKTAERHIANILKKLDFSSRTQIAVWAVEKGLRK